jgi:hypothetical protein
MGERPDSEAHERLQRTLVRNFGLKRTLANS